MEWKHSNNENCKNKTSTFEWVEHNFRKVWINLVLFLCDRCIQLTATNRDRELITSEYQLTVFQKKFQKKQ